MIYISNYTVGGTSGGGQLLTVTASAIQGGTFAATYYVTFMI